MASAPIADTAATRQAVLEPFQQSAALSLGVELELQLINTNDYDLAPYSDEMLRLMAKIALPGAKTLVYSSSVVGVGLAACSVAKKGSTCAWRMVSERER